MNKLNVLKKTVAIVVTIGTGSIVKQVIDHNTDAPETVTQKVTHTAGAFAIGGMIGARAEQYTDEWIDTIAAAIETGKQNAAAKQ